MEFVKAFYTQAVYALSAAMVKNAQWDKRFVVAFAPAATAIVMEFNPSGFMRPVDAKAGKAPKRGQLCFVLFFGFSQGMAFPISAAARTMARRVAA